QDASFGHFAVSGSAKTITHNLCARFVDPEDRSPSCSSAERGSAVNDAVERGKAPNRILTIAAVGPALGIVQRLIPGADVRRPTDGRTVRLFETEARELLSR